MGLQNCKICGTLFNNKALDVGVTNVVWICTNCGYRLEREGYTEICPYCWQPSMRGEEDVEQFSAPAAQIGNREATEGQA